MTTTANSKPTNLSKFQGLLRELFQFDCADLDFGIYRIMNYKRDVVERFITEQLPAFVAAKLDSGPLAQQAQAAADLAEAAQSIRSVAPNAIDDDGELDEQFHGSDAGQKYLEARPGLLTAAAAGTLSRLPSTFTSTPFSVATMTKVTSSPSAATRATSATSSPTTVRRSISTGRTATSTTSSPTSIFATTTGKHPTV